VALPIWKGEERGNRPVSGFEIWEDFAPPVTLASHLTPQRPSPDAPSPRWSRPHGIDDTAPADCPARLRDRQGATARCDRLQRLPSPDHWPDRCGTAARPSAPLAGCAATLCHERARLLRSYRWPSDAMGLCRGQRPVRGSLKKNPHTGRGAGASLNQVR